MGDSASFQNLDEELPYEWFSRGGCFNQDSIAGDYSCGMLDKNFCIFLNPDVGQGKLLKRI
jgi:hypothetical protein